MKAIINKTNNGDFYICIEAETTAEKLLLTSFRGQAEDRNGLMLFGGGTEFNHEADMPLDYNLNIKVNNKS